MAHHQDDLNFLARVSDALQTAMAEGLEGSSRVRGSVEPSALLSVFSPFMDHLEHGLPRERWLELVQTVCAHSTVTVHDGFLNQLYGGFQAPGIAGDWLASVLNMSMATMEISPVATVLESLLFRRARELVGYAPSPDAALSGCTLVPGGSNGNMVALLIARNALFPETKRKGLSQGVGREARPLCFFVSDEAHYSFEKAANATGLGTECMIRVPVDRAGRMEPMALAEAIKGARQRGMQPFFVGATAGTTVRAAFDPLEQLAEVCAAEGRGGLWLHVDAALGGTLLFSERGRRLMHGVSLADSIVWDSHKLMNVPLVASMLLCREPARLVESNSGGGEDYLFHARRNDRWDSGVSSLQCGRRADIFKIFFAWLMTGERGWAAAVDEHLSRTQKFGERVSKDHRFELVHPVQSVSLCFRVRGAGEGASGAVQLDQLALRDALVAEGRFMVNYAQDSGGPPYLRLVSLNNLLTDACYEQLFAALLRLAGHKDALLGV